MRTFGKVEPFSERDGTSDKTNTKYSFRYSGSNETMQNVLGSIVFFGEFLKSFLRFQILENFELLCFLFDLGKICHVI